MMEPMFATYYLQAIVSDREDRARRGVWRERFARISRAEKLAQSAAGRKTRRVIISKPAHLAGEHIFWV